MQSSQFITVFQKEKNLTDVLNTIQTAVMSYISQKNDVQFQEVAGMSGELDNEKFILEVFMKGEKIKLANRVFKQIIKLFIEAFRKNKIKIKLEVKQGDYHLSPFSPTANKHYPRFLVSVLTMSGIKLQDWLKQTEGLEDFDKYNLLLHYLDAIFYSPALFKLFNFELSKSDVSASFALKVFCKQIADEYDRICAAIMKISDANYSYLSKLVEVSMEGTESFTFKWDDIFSCLVKEVRGNLVAEWSAVKSFETYAKSNIRKYTKLVNQLTELLKKVSFLKGIHSKKEKLFEGIPEIDRIKVTGDSAFFENFPSIEMLERLDKEMRKDLAGQINNIYTNQYGIDQSMVYLKNHAVFGSAIDEELPEERSESEEISSSSAGDNEKNTSDSSSTMHLIQESSLGLFAPNEPSTTKEAKLEALEKIKKSEQRQEMHGNRHEKKEVVNSIEKVKPHNEYFISISTEEKKQEMKIIPVRNTKHLYLCTDLGEIFPSNLKEKIEAFQSVAEECRMLCQISLGQNGIKNYGLDLLVVKCKKYNNERLLFRAHRIQDTDDYVYLADKLVSHEEYEEHLKQPKNMKVDADKIRQSLVVKKVYPAVCHQEEKTNDCKI